MRAAALILVLLLVLGVAGCTPAVTDDLYMPTVEEDLTTCGADRMQHLVGLPRAEVEAMRLPQPVVLADLDSIPPEVIPERLSIEFLNYTHVTRVACG
jgi:hypothetical protein